MDLLTLMFLSLYIFTPIVTIIIILDIIIIWC